MKKIRFQSAVLLFFLIVGVLYVKYTWNHHENEKLVNAMQIARSIAATLPKDELRMLDAKPTDLAKPQYQTIKRDLSEIIRINNIAKFAYIYTQRNHKIYFIADSEPTTSSDYSPPGQEYSEAKFEDKQPFSDGKERITKAMPDRWGTWTSVLIPIKDDKTGEVLAVFGIDFSTKSWQKYVLIEVLESSILVFLLLLSLIFLFYIDLKIISLKLEAKTRRQVEDALIKSEKNYRLLFANSPATMWIYDLDTLAFLEVNQAAINHYGYTREEFLSMTIKDIRPSDDIPLLLEDVEQTINEYNSAGIWRHVTKNGEQLLVEISSVSIVFNERNARHVLIEDITLRKRAEEDLKESQSLYYSFIEQLPNAVFRNDIEGHFILVNSQFCQLTGLKKEHLIGKTAVEIDFNKNIIINIKEHLSKIDFLSTKTHFLILQTGTPVETNWEFTNLQGMKQHMYVLRMPVRSSNGSIIGTQGIMFDVTKQKESEKQLKLLSRAIENSPATVVITDKEGVIEYVNPKFTELTGYNLEESKGKNSRFLQSGTQTKEFYEELWKTILSGKDWHGEFHNKKKNGESYWERSIISSIVDAPNELSYFVAVKEDITEKKKMIEELVVAKEKAEESDRLKSAFLANMSHEIRTPMNGILGFAELLKEPELTGDQQQEYISIIERSGARMLNIINDIVDISRIESGQIKVVLSTTNINEQIDFIAKFFKTETDDKNLKLLSKTDLSDNEALIFTDCEKLYAILTNLVKNAIKYSITGTIEFGVTKCVAPDLAQSFDKIEKLKELQFYVKDTGIGIPKDRQEAIFERFIQAEIYDKMARQGAGLGLAISKAYVEMLGGKIWVESIEGIGSTFYFTIPYVTKSEEPLI